MKRLSTLFIFFGFGLFLFMPQMEAQNRHISIQGTLKDASGTSVADGDQQLTFKLYHSSGGDEVLWEETATVPVIGGIYSHNMGSVTEFPEDIFGQTLYLGVTVGGRELSPRTELTYAPYAISVASTLKIAQGGCSGQVGDIKYSILAPDDFAKENGDCWVPMDGDPIAAGNKLRDAYGFTNVPDMSGYFVRAHEYNDGVDDDRAPSSPVARAQDESFKSHGHGILKDQYITEIEGGGIDDDKIAIGIGNDRVLKNNVDFNGYTPKNDKYFWTGDNDDNGGDSFGIRFKGNSSNREISATGGNETRPDNMSFYIYIRIN